jgi:hypothetical protein
LVMIWLLLFCRDVCILCLRFLEETPSILFSNPLKSAKLEVVVECLVILLVLIKDVQGLLAFKWSFSTLTQYF